MFARRKIRLKCAMFFVFLGLISFVSPIIFPDYYKWLFYGTLHSNLPCFASEFDLENIKHMLKGFHAVTMKLNVTYWIDYGTLLGQYRMKNILPWDQDGDVGYLLM